MRKPKLTKKEEAALKAVRDLLAGGLIEHVHPEKLHFAVYQNFMMGMRKMFNMSYQSFSKECGTGGCIGGWMAAMMGKSINGAEEFVNANETGKFAALFYPNREGNEFYNYNKITTAQAVEAIDNFLKTGKPRWNTILKSI